MACTGRISRFQSRMRPIDSSNTVSHVIVRLVVSIVRSSEIASRWHACSCGRGRENGQIAGFGIIGRSGGRVG